jgi:hypothetical protein
MDNIDGESIVSEEILETEKNNGKALKSKKKKARKQGTAKKTTFAKRAFPKETLLKALNIAIKIKELNGGQPWDSSEIAKALGIGFSTNNFYYLSAAARDYGITIGTSKTAKIEISELGKQILYAPDQDSEKCKKIEAFLNIPIFKAVLDYYKGSNLPEMKYLGNTLEREFQLSPEFHEEFAKVFRENCEELGITDNNPLNQDNGSTNKPSIVKVGEPPNGKSNSLRVFVIMPFNEKNDKRPKGFFDEVLSSLIIPACLAANFSVATANKQGSDVIQSTIINDLLEADLVLADLTDHNPNVLFELGVRMAMDKPILLIKSSDTGKIFDVDNMLRVYEYNSNLWRSTIEKDLEKLSEHINAAWQNKDSEQTYMKILRKTIPNK